MDPRRLVSGFPCKACTERGSVPGDAALGDARSLDRMRSQDLRSARLPRKIFRLPHERALDNSELRPNFIPQRKQPRKPAGTLGRASARSSVTSRTFVPTRRSRNQATALFTRDARRMSCRSATGPRADAITASNERSSPGAHIADLNRRPLRRQLRCWSAPSGHAFPEVRRKNLHGGEANT